MPAKKKGKKGDKGKRKSSRLKALADMEVAKGKCKVFLKAYPTYCAASDSSPSPKIMRTCRESLEEDKLVTQVRTFTPLTGEAIGRDSNTCSV